MFTISSVGEFVRTFTWLGKLEKINFASILEKAGQRGVNALRMATPKESGRTAAGWSYEVKVKGENVDITWTNSNIQDGVPIAIILQYGHGTGTGGYVAGRNYINPAIAPIFDEIARDVWKAVTAL
jgi:hypothetical protein